MKVICLLPILCCAVISAFADNSYFPVKTKDGAEGLTKFEAQWYSKSLERMKEPRLPELAKDVNAEAYRVIILPTWGNPIVVRVQRLGKTFRLSARRLDGQAGYDPGKLVESKDIDLSAEDSSTLETLVKNLDFLKLSTDEKGINGEDGEEWVLEGVSQGRYHVVQRWSASSYKSAERGLTAFLDLFKFLLDKSDLSERPKNKGYKLM
jgi:hypothetical protein